jgi:hypothetical protein
VRVLPDEGVLLVDGLGPAVASERTRRTRVGELSPGERIFVRGVLSGVAGAGTSVYRDAAATPTVRPPARGRMLISSEPLGERYHARARFHRAWAIGFLVALAVHSVWFGPFYDRLLHGAAVTATVTDLGSYTTTRKGHTTRHYVVDADWQGAALHAEIDGASFRALEIGGPAPFFVVPARPGNHNFGAVATADVSGLAVWSVLLILLAAAYASSSRATLPWYLRRRFTETFNGHLPG